MKIILLKDINKDEISLPTGKKMRAIAYHILCVNVDLMLSAHLINF